MSRLTPFGVIDTYFWKGDNLQPGPILSWSSFHAQRILERLDAEGYEIVSKERPKDYQTALHEMQDIWAKQGADAAYEYIRNNIDWRQP